jgi:hypothetical protein
VSYGVLAARRSALREGGSNPDYLEAVIAGLVPAIHVLLCFLGKKSRGWPGQARP